DAVWGVPGDDLCPRQDPAVRQVFEDRSAHAGLELELCDPHVLELAHRPRVRLDRPPRAHLFGEEFEGAFRNTSNRHHVADRLCVSLVRVGADREPSSVADVIDSIPATRSSPSFTAGTLPGAFTVR